MPGNQDNIIGVCFTEKDNEPLEIMEWDLKNKEIIKTSISEIQSQVLAGLRLVNQYLNTNYRVSKIYYVPVDDPSNSVYEFLIQELVKQLQKILEQQNWVNKNRTFVNPMDKNSSPGFTSINTFESDVMGITPRDNSQFNNP